MPAKWADFETRVRDVAGQIHSSSCAPAIIAGNAIDGVISSEDGTKILIEITTEHDLDKVRADANKLVLARTAEFMNGILCKAMIVLEREPTRSMTDAGTSLHIEVLSAETLGKRFIDYELYRATRVNSAFGSAVNPSSGERDLIRYISVCYRDRERNISYSAEDLSSRLMSGRNVILLGEYGSGKSRCISEIFRLTSADWRTSGLFPFAINLRECWGLQRGYELVRRHLDVLGLDELSPAAVRAYNGGRIICLLDGFDEIGVQSWSSDDARLRQIRSQALAGVRDVAHRSGTGVLVAGREHYFSSNREMFSALGMTVDDTIVVHVNEEFSEGELSEYFEAADIDISIPEWLPRRPLICQTISNLSDDELSEMFGAGSQEAVFWGHFISTVCRRDARINGSFDEETLYRVFIALARLTRTKMANVGPISQRELQNAFESVVGQLPAEDASVMLQRLPSLGRVSSETADRQFIDMYILDGLRARDTGELLAANDADRRLALNEQWTNPLGLLGQKVFAYDTRNKHQAAVTLAKRAASQQNSTLCADIVSSLMRSGKADFDNLEVSDASFSLLDFSITSVRGLTIKSSVIDELTLPSTPPVDTQILDSIAGKVNGVSAITGLPAWLKLTSVDEFSSVQTTSRIRDAGLAINHEILVAVIKKTFFQKGTGRKEEALLRGFGSGSANHAAPRILNLLVREGVLRRFRGEDGWVYAPERNQTGRMKAMLEELQSSADAIWADVAEI